MLYDGCDLYKLIRKQDGVNSLIVSANFRPEQGCLVCGLDEHLKVKTAMVAGPSAMKITGRRLLKLKTAQPPSHAKPFANILINLY